jgi:hypothetical protein
VKWSEEAFLEEDSGIAKKIFPQEMVLEWKRHGRCTMSINGDDGQP